MAERATSPLTRVGLAIEWLVDVRLSQSTQLMRAVEAGKTLGRPRISPALEKLIQTQLRAGKGINTTAREVGVGTGTVQRVKREMTGPFADMAA